MKVAMNKTLQAILDSAKEKEGFWVDSAKLDFAIALENWRKHAGKSYNDVAISLKTSPAYISKVFRGDANLTIESMVKLARVLGCRLDIKLNSENEKQESLKFSYDSTTAIPSVNHRVFDSFVTDKSGGHMGHFRFPGAQSQEPSNSHRYENAA